MTNKKIKIFVTAAFSAVLIGGAISNLSSPPTVFSGATVTAADAAADYKSKCAACHSPKAEKFFDPAKPLDEHTQIILKGKKTSKPPMPGYEEKGMTAEQARTLAEYMLQLRKPSGGAASNTDASGNSNAQGNTTSGNRNANSGNANSGGGGGVNKLDEQIAATYKSKCSACHAPKAEKFFDTAKKDEILAEIVLKGVKTSKPPMPGYADKGMKSDEALALVAYMRGLRDAKK